MTNKTSKTFDFFAFSNCDVATFFLSEYASDFVCIDNGGKSLLYYWNDDEKIWCAGLTAGASAKQLLKTDVRDKLSKLCIDYQSQELSKAKKIKNVDDREAKISEINKQYKSYNAKIANNLGSKRFLNDTLEEIEGSLLLEAKAKSFDTNKELIDSLNFTNGILELDKLKQNSDGSFNWKKCFRQREQTDYVSKTLEWKFTSKVDKKALSEIESIFEQIQPNEEQRELQLTWLAYCLTGRTNEQKFKMNIGYSASNGKSTETDIHSTVFELYSMNLDKRTFNEKYEKRHKQFASMIESPIRYVYIEELDRDKLDIDVMKHFVDGKKQSIEKMYGTTMKGYFQGKLNTTSNKDPNLGSVDKGILRRGICQHYTSQFYLDTKEYEANKTRPNVFKADKYLTKNFDMVNYKNAYLHMLAPYIVKFYAEGLVVPEVVKENFKDIAEEYDTIKNTLENVYEITNNENDRVHIDDLTAQLNSALNSKYNRNTMISEMKRIGLQYVKNKYVIDDKAKRLGVVVGLKEKVVNYESDDDDPLDRINKAPPPTPAPATTPKQAKPEPESDDDSAPVSHLNKLLQEIEE